MTLVAVGAIVGCGDDGIIQVPVDQIGPADAGCHITSSTPAFDATGVFVRQPLGIHWSEPIDVATVEANVVLKDLGGDSIPFSVEQTSLDTVVLHPEQSMWFWGEY